MAYITRKIFLEARNCMRKAWLMARDLKNGVQEELSEHQEFLIGSGGRIKELAAGNFPGGVLVEGTNAAAAAETTRELIKNGAAEVIFDASFINGHMAARPDIIRRRENGGWEIIDVKNSPYSRGGARKPRGRSGKYFTEAAFNLMVMRECGIKISGVSAMYVSRRYRLGMGASGMFTTLECSAEAEKLVKSFEKYRESIREALSSSEIPKASMTTICKNCDYYKSCPVSEIKDPVFLFNSINQKTFARMIDDGYLSISDIPDGYFKYPADGLYYMMRESVKTGKPFIGPGFIKTLRSVKWPAYYLDFESLASVLPVYETSSPYEHLPVQYSIHLKDSPSTAPENIRHCEYIAGPGRDSRRELFETLLENIGSSGSIIVYSDFEKLCIKRAAERYPSLRDRLNAMLPRIFDLCGFMRENYYHPDFNGAYSIKKTLPVLVPSMSYSGLAVQNGADAIVKHYNLAAGNLTPAECERLKKELSDYCALDTMAMVKLHESLLEIAGNLS